MAGKIVSLYINDVCIRLMVVRGRRIVKIAEAPLDAGLGEIDIKEQEDDLVNRIRVLLKYNKIRPRKIILGISGLHCLTRPLTLPELPQKMLHEAITRESRRVLPVPLDQLYLSWQIVGYSQGKIQAYVVALPRQIADMAIRVANKAGCKPYLMDIKPLALARLSPEANAVIIDVQAKEFDIINVANGIPQPIRTVSFPQEKLALPEKFAIVKDEVLRTVRFYNENSADKSIKPDTAMLVSGELAGTPDLYESLASELGLKASLLTSPLKCVKQLDASHYLVNVGLALKELTPKAAGKSPNFNALPAPYLPKRLSLKQILAVPAAALAVALIALTAMSVQDMAADIDSLSAQVMTNNITLEKNLAQKRTLLKNISELQIEVNALTSQYSAWEAAYIEMNQTGDLMNTDLKTVVVNVVENLDLAELVHSSGQVIIEGESSTELEVLEYVRILQDTGRFNEITITSIERVEPDDANVYHLFSLRCYLKEGRP